ncbi:hypothetical protein GCM10009753_04530 [Streptantibioticus ferralitis]
MGVAVAGLLLAPQALAQSQAAAPHTPGAPHYDHVFTVVEENHGYGDLIGNPAAPNLNALAQTYGSATNYTAITHPSEPNYIAMLGGSTFNVKGFDNPYYVNKVNAPSLISQLDQAHVGWKAYFQNLPHAGYQGICYPANCNGTPDKDPLYAAKHNGIANFTTSWNKADWARQVPMDQLTQDLRSGHVPQFGYVVPSECLDMHGDPPYCVDSGTTGGKDPQDQRLVAQGDAQLGQLVAQITGASFWAHGNNAINVVVDEGDDSDTSGAGGGHTVNVVVTSHGPRHLQDPTAYSHYSMLRTLQDNFGVACLQHSCDTATHPMSPMYAVSGEGSAAQAFRPLPVPQYATPTPVPSEPLTTSTFTGSQAGWTVQTQPQLGTSDNDYGAVAVVSPKDVWAVGSMLPDTANSNQDAMLSLAAHYDGTKWTSTPIGHVGTNFNALYGVAAVPGRAWAVGVAIDSHYQSHSLMQEWDGHTWHPVALPKINSIHDTLYAATATSANDVWAVGDRESANGVFTTLVEHFDGHRWSVVPTPNPGATGNHLFGITARSPHDIWAVGQRNDATNDAPLVEHFDGHRWTAVNVPAASTTTAFLQAVTVTADGQVWAAGQSDDAQHQARPLALHRDANGHWTATLLTNIGSDFSNVTGIAVSHGVPWLVGSYLDTTTQFQKPLVASLQGGRWEASDVPYRDTNDSVLGGIAAAKDGQLWTVGYGRTDSGRFALVEHHSG